MLILSAQTASAIYAGFADKGWVNKVSQVAAGWLSSGAVFVDRLVDLIKNGAYSFGDFLKRGWNFFTQWFREDPLGASAGVAAAVGVGVLLVVGGTALGPVVGGLSLVKVLAGLATSAAIGIGNAILGNPIGKCIRWLVRGTQFLYNFNWNASDKQYADMQKSALTRLYAASGSVLGTSIGGLACGSLAGIALVKLNVANLAKIWEVAGDDLKEEIVSACNSLLSQTANFVATSAFTEIYKNARKAIKFFTGNGKKLKGLLPHLSKGIAAWGEEGSKPWSFAAKVEEFVEGIDDKNLQAFTENFLESAMESCTEVLIATSGV